MSHVKGYELAKKRTKQMTRFIAVKPVHEIMAYCYMLAVQDMAEINEIILEAQDGTKNCN